MPVTYRKTLLISFGVIFVTCIMGKKPLVLYWCLVAWMARKRIKDDENPNDFETSN